MWDKFPKAVPKQGRGEILCFYFYLTGKQNQAFKKAIKEGFLRFRGVFIGLLKFYHTVRQRDEGRKKLPENHK